MKFFLDTADLAEIEEAASWGALAGVRPTKITTKQLLEGGTPKSADRLLRDVYYVTGDRRRLAIDCSVSTVRAVNMLQPIWLTVAIQMLLLSENVKPIIFLPSVRKASWQEC